MIRVEIDPLFSDELAAFKAHRRHRRVHLVLALTSAAAVLAVLLYNLIRYDKPGLVELVVLPSAYVALVLLGLGWDRLALWFRWRAKNKRIPGADMTITAIYSDEGLKS